ncbi:MAG: tetratricopeptide repeat protein [Bacteroidetes bacterium]|nr:MAG: tetratricopeptide repeat protein [Bacteroidota bacterium]
MVFTFYSYKGGVGRTHLLANIASYLCYYQKRKILLIDWDLEAPGLHFYFDKKNEEIKTKGLIDLLNEQISLLRNTDKEVLTENDFYNPLQDVKNEYIQNIITAKNGGKIDLMPATQYSAGYHTKIEDFDWIKFYDQQYGGSYLLWLKNQLKSQYDYVLIDSRTGFNDYSGICNVLMPDMNIVVVAPNEQNFEGAKIMTKRIIEANYTKSEARKPFVLPVLSRIDVSDDRSDDWKTRFATEFSFVIPSFDEDLKTSTKEVLERVSALTIMIYNRRFAMGENIHFKEEAIPLPFGSYLSNFENIALHFLEQMNEKGEINLKKLVGNEMIPVYLNNIAKKPKDADSHFGLGSIYYELENYEQAKKYMSNVVEIEPDHYDAWYNLGILYDDGFQDHEKSKEAYLKAIAIKPDDHEAWYNLGILYRNGFQDYEKSKEAYLKAITIKPDKHEAWNNLGLLYLTHFKDYEKSKEAYLKAIAIKPDKHEAWYNLACWYSLQKNKREALAYLHKAIVLNPDKLKPHAKTDTDFEWLWEDIDFLALVQG